MSKDLLSLDGSYFYRVFKSCCRVYRKFEGRMTVAKDLDGIPLKFKSEEECKAWAKNGFPLYSAKDLKEKQNQTLPKIE